MFGIAEVPKIGVSWLWWLLQLPAILLGLALVAYGIFVCWLFLVSRGTLKRAQKALDEGRLADAVGLFRKVAKMEFGQISARGTGSPRFDDAMLGIVMTYSRAGKTVDLKPLGELRADLKALHSDKKYRSGSGKGHSGQFTKVGMKILERIVSEAHAVLDKLPSLDR